MFFIFDFSVRSLSYYSLCSSYFTCFTHNHEDFYNNSDIIIIIIINIES